MAYSVGTTFWREGLGLGGTVYVVHHSAEP